MDPDVLFLFAAGFEQTGDDQFIFYFDGPVPRRASARLKCGGADGAHPP